MTVKEAIVMSATLRLGKKVSKEKVDKKVKEMLSVLKLNNCCDTVVGDASIKGVSGGERKRCAMAMEMITDPSVLFLDEPTSVRSKIK